MKARLNSRCRSPTSYQEESRTTWKQFEEAMADLLVAYWYGNVRTQVQRKAQRSAKAARRAFPSQPYIATPRFDIVARHPILQRERVVECKEYSVPVSANLVEGFAYRLWLCKIPFRKGIIAARPLLTNGAIKLAESYGMTYWHGGSLERKLVMASGLALKPIEAITRGIRYTQR